MTRLGTPAAPPTFVTPPPDTVTDPPGRVTECVGSPLETVMVPDAFFVTVNPDEEFGMYSLTRPLDTTAVPAGRPAEGAPLAGGL